VQDILNIKYSLSSDARVSATVFSINGAELIKLESKSQISGQQQISIHINSLEKGMYFLQLEVNGEKTTHKFNVIK